MWFALEAAEHGTVALVTKAEFGESNSRYAQGGIAAVWDEDDNFDAHIQDTLMAGAGLCRREAVEVTVREAPSVIHRLIDLGTEFTKKADDTYSLHREGGHSARRILHSDDLTGAEMVRALGEACKGHPRIQVATHQIAVDLITSQWLARQEGEIPEPTNRVLGAYVLDTKEDLVHTYGARAVVLATGGAGKVYVYTTNPDVATGDGMAMAYRAGARVANMEFVQFHPTSLYHPRAKSFLISEALRGDGGLLYDADGHRFMLDYDERAELAPRDVVARAIDAELKRTGRDCAYLDMRHLSGEELSRRFPNIDARLKSLGIDMSKERVPVVPAAHYFCGGVQTDLHGESNVENLFAIGESSCTGLHGANRLASNSLLEACVFATRAAARLAERELPPHRELPEWNPGSAVDSDELVVITQTWEEIRRFMWNYVGIVRTHRRLKRALRRIHLIRDEINRYYWDFRVTADLIELRNLAKVAELVIESALKRRESRGLHYTLDFPERDARWIHDTTLMHRY
ncbi:MAG: L-aspartate oxidase [Proteobacteria bacterium]|nr:L-aspartate oxidase [Pseudomonadota bacterium]